MVLGHQLVDLIHPEMRVAKYVVTGKGRTNWDKEYIHGQLVTETRARLQIVSTGVTTGVNHVSAVCLKGAPSFKPRP